MRSIRRLLRNFFDIRAQELERAILMSAYLLLIIACYTTTKAVRDSLFVTEIGPSQLPWVYLLIAGAMGVVSFAYSRVIRKIGLFSLVRMTTLLAISSLLFFWWVLRYDPDGWLYVLYVWVSIFGAITASETWLLATHVFNAREARRLFAWIGTGGILGGFLGGTLTRTIAPWLGTEALLLVSAGMMLATIGLLQRITHTTRAMEHDNALEEPDQAKERKGGRLFHMVRESRQLSLMVVLLALGVVVQAFIDYEFKVMVRESFALKDQLTAFLGTVASYIGLLSLVIQLAVTNRILKKVGVGPAIMALPIGLLAASIFLAARPTLLAAATLQVIDGALSYSIHRSSMELLYLPIPSNVRNSIKAFIDTFVDRFGRAVGGLLLLLFTTTLSFSISSLSIVASILLVIWIIAAFAVKREYLHSFRLALEKKTIEPESVSVSELDRSTTRTLLDALSSEDERQVLYALDLLGNTHPAAWRRYQRMLIQHPSSAVRQRTIALLSQWEDTTAAPLINESLRDSNLTVRAEAVHYLYRSDKQPSIRLMEFLNHEDQAIVHGTVHFMSRYDLPATNGIDHKLVDRALQARGERGISARIAAASALNLLWTGSAMLRRNLDRLLRDSSHEVAIEAIQTTVKVRYDAAIPVLISMLANGRLRRDAREALLKFGDQIFPELEQRLLDPGEPLEVRVRIPKVLAYSGRQAAADILVSSLYRVPANLDLWVMKALNRMRLQFPEIVFQREAVLDLVQQERDEYRKLQMMFHWLRARVGYSRIQHENGATGPVFLLLIRTILEKASQKLEKIFRLLALTYPPNDIYSAYYNCTSRPEMRASAVEFLDNLLEADFKPLVIPLVEEPIGVRIKDETNEPPFTTLSGILRDLDASGDPWLQTLSKDLAEKLQGRPHRRTGTK